MSKYVSFWAIWSAVCDFLIFYGLLQLQLQSCYWVAKYVSSSCLSLPHFSSVKLKLNDRLQNQNLLFVLNIVSTQRSLTTQMLRYTREVFTASKFNCNFLQMFKNGAGVVMLYKWLRDVTAAVTLQQKIINIFCWLIFLQPAFTWLNFYL